MWGRTSLVRRQGVERAERGEHDPELLLSIWGKACVRQGRHME